MIKITSFFQKALAILFTMHYNLKHINAVDQETGLLTKKFTLPISGDYPKDLMIFPDNKHIAVANHASNSITVFTVDYEKNIIMMNEKPRKIETPNCIHIWPVPDTWEQLD